ncbi:HD-GYP domain-containing protein [Sporomusa sphaeroides]|uniref:Cyclic di-GMP phosphodiesterase response regulator RpfG n=1 Tax=Sporomusa sphaeroides DSM 2875 TaxID=1337886 RepID=A0A1U7MA15_9FIRM|nr:HD-GYP domain-containing protein [Sporomusa sphaeroides]OLS54362.1 cyclic di-GMP phosphodiesterase response regulator RpfG [Sporomusa sphaeroides DSM 2875]CVK21658.1 Cyclic di-GMP phosphodiesterase response regulator RpfG [Sporomusa sphaeroides DSM 2875]
MDSLRYFNVTTGDPLVNKAITNQLNDIIENTGSIGVSLNFISDYFAEYEIGIINASPYLSFKLSDNARDIGTLKVFFSDINLNDYLYIADKTMKISKLIKNLVSLKYLKSSRNELISFMLTNLIIIDSLTYLHLKQVQKYAVYLGKVVGLSSEQLNALSISALLHDIGKLAIPDSILKKKTHLTESEFQIMKNHPYFGFEYLISFPDFIQDAYIAFYHHERWDGFGYPYGLSGNNIPLEARILAIADAYDAMIGFRHYKKPFNISEALDELKKQAGKQFDPNLITVFTESIRKTDYLQGSRENAIKGSNPAI